MKVAIEVDGIRELRKALKKVDATLPRELRAANKDVADYVKDKAQIRAGSGTRQQAAAKKGIRSGAESDKSKLIIGGARNPFSIGAYFGAKQYKQFPEWVGTNWQPGEAGGPEIIGETFQSELDNIFEMYGDAIDNLIRKAFI